MNRIFHVSIIIAVTYSADLSFLSKAVKEYKPGLNSDEENPTTKWLLEPATAKILIPMDSVMNTDHIIKARRQNAKSSSGEYSSSGKEEDFQKEWHNVHWKKKQVEVLNKTAPRGDTVNMVAARPWGVSCGDPSIHDMPWGTCMLAMECEAELRIMKGDYFCGQTLVCCGIIDNVYDLYKGFDASLASIEDSGQKDTNTELAKKRQAARDKQRRDTDRKLRKKRMMKSIKKIVREVQSILNKIYNNGTKEKRKKTKQMKKFIQELKLQYKKDRQAMKDIHEVQMIYVDTKLRDRLEEIRQLNDNFMKNATFRDIIVNGTVTINGARMLIEAYPELESYFSRPSGRRRNDYLDYDVEYGLLYQ